MSRRLLATVALIAVLSAGLGAAIRYWVHGDTEDGRVADFQTHAVDENAEAQVLPQFAFPDLDGTLRRSSDWKDKILVLNFWATWCPPCLKEMPGFIKLQDEFAERGVQFVGIAVDTEQAVRDFVGRHGVNYPVLLGEQDATALSMALGNRFSGLPFTAVFDRAGRRVYAHAGELNYPELKQRLLPLL